MILYGIIRRFDYYVVCRLYRHPPDQKLYWVREAAFNSKKSSAFSRVKTALSQYPGAILLKYHLDDYVNVLPPLWINGDWVSIYVEYQEGDLLLES